MFLTHREPATALRLAGDLVFNLATFGLAHDRPTLVRGSLAFGEVEHVRNVFLANVSEPANLVGPGVLDQPYADPVRALEPRCFCLAT